MMTALTGKVALVTGGARGIGRGIALALAEAGTDVALAEVNRLGSSAQQYGEAVISGVAAAQQTVGEIQALGRKALVIEADVTRKSDTLRMIDQTVAALGRLDILVCNAGVVSISTVEKMPEDTWDVTMAVNAKGVFLSCQAAIPRLRQNGGGCIINIASVAGKNGAAGMAHYCASKFAVVG